MANICFSFATRCRHWSIAEFFGEHKPACNDSCDACRTPKKVERDLVALQTPNVGSRIAVSTGDAADDLYGGGRLGAKRLVCTSTALHSHSHRPSPPLAPTFTATHTALHRHSHRPSTPLAPPFTATRTALQHHSHRPSLPLTPPLIATRTALHHHSHRPRPPLAPP